MRHSVPGLPGAVPESFLKVVPKPGAGVRPFLTGLVNGNPEHCRYLFMPDACEMPQLDSPSRERVLNGKSRQRFVERNEIYCRCIRWRIPKFDALGLPAAFEPAFPTGAFHENPTHRGRCRRVKMTSTDESFSI
jgi:hypothetical protein